MRKKPDSNKIARYEKAIAAKYGKKAILNPKSGWSKQKEKKHLESAKKFYNKCSKVREKIQQGDISKRQSEASFLPCGVCGKLFLTPIDEVCVIKYDCCHDCYIKFVEGREERWKGGWRPDKESVFKKN